MRLARPTPRLVRLLALGGALAVLGLVSDLALWAVVGLDLLLLVAFWVDQRGLPAPGEVQADRRFEPRMAHGVQAEVRVGLVATRAAFARVIDEAPPLLVAPEAVEQPRPVRLIAGGRAEVVYPVRPRRRGRHPFGRLNLMVEGPWGLAQARLILAPIGATEVQVFPDVGAIDQGALDPALLMAELGIKRVRRRAEGTEFESLREAVPEDGLRRIDWRATARRGKPIARNYEPERNHEVLICLDTGRLMGTLHARDDADAIHRSKLDAAIQAALRIGAVALRNGDRVGLFAFDDRVTAYVAPDRGRAQLGRLLEAVHDLEPSRHDASFPWALGELRRRQKKRALLLFLSDFVDAEASRELGEAVSILGRRHLVLFVALRDPYLALAQHAPVESAADAYRALAALSLDEARAVLIETLNAQGVRALDLPPQEVTIRGIQAYLQLRAEGRL